MEKHTPGPWEFGGKFSREVYEKRDGIEICTVPQGDSFCADGCQCDECEERYANARLIAAAPELLEALSQIVNHATKYGGAPLAAVKMFDRARAALAKADGKPVSA